MGAGVAREIKKRFPDAWEADKVTHKGDRSKLGSFSSAKVDDKLIINAYTQYNYGGSGDLFEYSSWRNICKTLSNTLNPDYAIALPKIGAGLAKGNWNKIERIIEEELDNFNVYVYYL
jgi:O-acetyl-ADP-ribose deacetylase (regulator of RNase III)